MWFSVEIWIAPEIKHCVDVHRTLAPGQKYLLPKLSSQDNMMLDFLFLQQYEMDHRIFEELNRQTSQRIQLVQKELAWEREKHLIGLQKLHNQWVPLYFYFFLWPCCRAYHLQGCTCYMEK